MLAHLCCSGQICQCSEPAVICDCVTSVQFTWAWDTWQEYSVEIVQYKEKESKKIRDQNFSHIMTHIHSRKFHQLIDIFPMANTTSWNFVHWFHNEKENKKLKKISPPEMNFQSNPPKHNHNFPTPYRSFFKLRTQIS